MTSNEYMMTTDEYMEYLSRRMKERTKNCTPEEATQTFIRLGILDEDGNVVPGREELVWHLQNFPIKE